MLPFLVHLYYTWIVRGEFSFACLRIAAFFCALAVSVILLLFVCSYLFIYWDL